MSRRKSRKGKNLFWLTRSTRKGSKILILFNREPYKEDWSFCEYADDYYDKKIWFSCHGESYPRKETCLTKFLDITHEKAIPVKLVIDTEGEPDLFIQRVRDNLFIGPDIFKVYCGSKMIEKFRISHHSRISNKLFPEITDETEIVGVRIERI